MIDDIIAGLTILRQYYKPGSLYVIGAEHDTIYAYATDRTLTHDDVHRMREHGWFQEGIEDDTYNPEESWTHFT